MAKRKSLLIHENNSNNNDDFILVRRKSRKRPLTPLFVVIFILFIGAGVFAATKYVETIPEKEYCFELMGDSIIHLNAGDTFVDPGVKLVEKDRNRSDKVTVSGLSDMLDENQKVVPGEYFLYYSIENGIFKKMTLCRIVVVGGES